MTVACPPYPFDKLFVSLIVRLMFTVGESLVLRSFHPDAKEYYNHRFNLETVCKALSHPNDSYADLKIELFSIFSPQLAEKCEIIGKIFESAQGPKPVLVETKLDGDRCQFHMRRTSKGMEFRYARLDLFLQRVGLIPYLFVLAATSHEMVTIRPSPTNLTTHELRQCLRTWSKTASLMVKCFCGTQKQTW